MEIEQRNIHCICFDAENACEQMTSQLYLDTFVTLVVLSGRAVMIVNYQNFELHQNMAAFLSSHLFKVKEVSRDFQCIALFVSKNYMEEYDPADIIPLRTKYAVKMYSTPMVSITEDEVEHLRRRWETIKETLQDTTHYYYDMMVKNVLIAYYLDLSNSFERHKPNGSATLTRPEIMTRSFIECLTLHFREEHQVDFYADQLHISSTT